MFQSGEETVLVCTSLASRGLDTKQVRATFQPFLSFKVERIHFE